MITALQGWSFFWDWDAATNQVRWMTSWDTTADDVDRFAAGVAAAIEQGWRRDACHAGAEFDLLMRTF